MRQKTKHVLSILIILLLSVQNTHQALALLKHKSSLQLLLKSRSRSVKINDPSLTNSNDAVVPNPKFDVNEAKEARSSRELVRQIIGDSAWEKIQNALKQLGSKWQEKINTIFDTIPLDLQDKVADRFQASEISSTLESIKNLKQEADERMKEIEFTNEDPLRKANIDSPDIYGFILDNLEAQYNIDILEVSKKTSKELINMLKETEAGGEKGKKIMNKDLDEIIKKYALNHSKLEKLASFGSEHRFEQSQSGFDFLKVVPNLGEDELFVPKYVDPDRDDPPPNDPEGGANCWDTGSCKLYGLITMKCTVMRIIMRLVYQIICGMVNIFGLVMIGLCACVIQKEPPYYEGQAEMSCNNRSSWPGLICMIPYGLFVALYGFTFALWKIIWGLTQICKVPIGSVEIASPP